MKKKKKINLKKSKTKSKVKKKRKFKRKKKIKPTKRIRVNKKKLRKKKNKLSKRKLVKKFYLKRRKLKKVKVDSLTRKTILKVIRFQDRFSFKFNLNIDQSLQRFFQKIANTLDAFKVIIAEEKERKRKLKIKQMKFGTKTIHAGQCAEKTTGLDLSSISLNSSTKIAPFFFKSSTTCLL